MAVDATGTPTALGIPKYNPDADAPTGNGFNAAMDAIDSIITAKALPTGVTDGPVVWNGSAWVSAKLTDNNIASNAGIKASKLLWSEGSTPPSSPSEGDLWLHTFSHSSIVHKWLFVYDAGSDATYPWAFVGGAPMQSQVDSEFLVGAGWGVWGGPTFTFSRTGWYAAAAGCVARIDNAPLIDAFISVGTNANPGNTLAEQYQWTFTSTGDRMHPSVERLPAVFAAGHALGMTATATGASWVARDVWIRALPIRVQ